MLVDLYVLMPKIGLILIMLVTLNLGCNGERDLDEARKCANAFHTRIKAQNYEAIYTDASQRFKNVRSKESFIAMMKEIQSEYGKLLNVKEESTVAIANAEVGKAQEFIFSLEFENTKAIEHLIVAKDENGQMRIWMFELS